MCVVCPNDSSEVDYLINRLGPPHLLTVVLFSLFCHRLSLVSKADYVLQLSVPSGAKDKSKLPVTNVVYFNSLPSDNSYT